MEGSLLLKRWKVFFVGKFEGWKVEMLPGRLKEPYNIKTFQPYNNLNRILRQHNFSQHGITERRGHIMRNDFLIKILIVGVVHDTIGTTKLGLNSLVNKHKIADEYRTPNDEC